MRELPEVYYHRGESLAITEMGLRGIPEPADETFRRRFWRLLQEADDEAHAIMESPPRRLARSVEPEVPPTDPVRQPYRRHRRGVVRPCVGCGGPLDECTPGCHNCYSRHHMRQRAQQRAAEASSAVA